MKCIADRRCQKRMPDGRARYFAAGEMEEFEECPEGFTPVEDAKVVMIGEGAVLDFANLKDDVIRQLDFDTEDLKTYMAKTLPDITWAHNIGHDNLVEKYLYARSANAERSEVLAASASPVLDPVAAATTNVVDPEDDGTDLDSLLED